MPSKGGAEQEAPNKEALNKRPKCSLIGSGLYSSTGKHSFHPQPSLPGWGIGWEAYPGPEPALIGFRPWFEPMGGPSCLQTSISILIC